MAWHAQVRGGFARSSTEAYENTMEVYSILTGLGWSVNAICGMWGNVERESGYNPWRWQGDNVLPRSQSPWYNHGYGLYQFTNAGKYINSDIAKAYPGYGPNLLDETGLPTDGHAQLLFVAEDLPGDWITTGAHPNSFPDWSYSRFKTSTDDVSFLTSVWMWNYERPSASDPTLPDRQEAARYWYGVLSGTTPPDPPDPPDPGPGLKFTKTPFWFYTLRKI